VEGEVDRDELRFRLDWPAGEDGSPEDDLTDFSFEWEEEAAEAPETALLLAGEPQVSEPHEILAPATDTGFIDSTEALDTVRRALDENNDALRQLSEAVYELASNVRLLVDEVGSLNNAVPRVGDGHAGDVTASAMVTLSAEMTAALETLATELKVTRTDMQGLMDDVVAAAGGASLDARDIQEPRVLVELERVQNELTALKRRLPVRAAEFDPADIADRVADIVLSVLHEDAALARPAARPVEAAPARPRKAAAKRAPVKARPEPGLELEIDDVEPEPALPHPAPRAKRQRPLRAD
jgi:hypothetical protein